MRRLRAEPGAALAALGSTARWEAAAVGRERRPDGAIGPATSTWHGP
ncbi:hypothetical protein [Sorangium sp. So ce887]